MVKYQSVNCFEYIESWSYYIEKAKVTNNNLYLIFDSIEITKKHPLNPFNNGWEINKATLTFYDFEVIDAGYYDCSHVQKQEIIFDKDCLYVPTSLLELINDFTLVTEDMKEQNETFFEHCFEGWAWKFGEDIWGYFKICYTRMEMTWDSFYNQRDK
ncbi:hypothetical protein P4388_00060 [Bacillus thuringiensis]|uniref:Uncharacterized protein n=2 Tax=Bacillus cereus group TaxID=86661 RepID=A0A9X6WBD4_BACTU|nr:MULTISPECIES: hypothetical protein [Bacillus]KXY53803.1 hypothetical protein AT261_13725 [Bacillus cereus]MBK5495509.1 hypothetical protein [Bacillus sp. TH13]MCC6081122.1 hypothetical protein [Bacillus thuringiensis]MED1899782.1 hypothetical protein [Bacillus thuringiensis]MED3347079.1 hypothetical protein [Bacillus thuringiensis]